MSLGEEDNTTGAPKTLQKNCFSGCESRSLVGWTSTTTRWTLTPVSSKLAAVSLRRKKRATPEVVFITDYDTKDMVTCTAKFIYDLKRQRSLQHFLTIEDLPEQFHTVVIPSGDPCHHHGQVYFEKKKTHPLKYVSWSVPHEIFTACRKKYIDGAKW